MREAEDQYIITPTPSPAQLQQWWDAMEHDDLRVAFSDAFPKTLPQFCAEVAAGDKYLFFCLDGAQVAGSMWLYRLEEDPCWVGVYFLRDYRGAAAQIFARKALQYATHHLGIPHIFAAVHVHNRASKRFTESMYFTRVARIEAFSLFQGRPTASFIYTLHPADVSLAQDLAQAHARLLHGSAENTLQ